MRIVENVPDALVLLSLTHDEKGLGKLWSLLIGANISSSEGGRINQGARKGWAGISRNSRNPVAILSEISAILSKNELKNPFQVLSIIERDLDSAFRRAAQLNAHICLQISAEVVLDANYC